MKQQPLISVIVPVYKVEDYVEKCIESIVSQTYTNLEIILVDDGSPDLSGQICDRWKEKDKRIVVVHKKNDGLSSARNAGLDIAKGEFIGFVDSDDYIEPNMYQKLYQTLKNNGATLSMCMFFVENLQGKAASKFPPMKDGVYTGRQVMRLIGEKNYAGYVVAWNKLYSKRIFENLRYKLHIINEDQQIIHYIFDKCDKVAVVPDKLYHYIIRTGSIMQASNPIKYLDEIDHLFERIDFFKNKDLDCLIVNYVDVIYVALKYVVAKVVAFGKVKKEDASKINLHKQKFYDFCVEQKECGNITKKQLAKKRRIFKTTLIEKISRLLSNKPSVFKNILKHVYIAYVDGGIIGVVIKSFKIFAKVKKS